MRLYDISFNMYRYCIYILYEYEYMYVRCTFTYCRVSSKCNVSALCNCSTEIVLMKEVFMLFAGTYLIASEGLLNSVFFLRKNIYFLHKLEQDLFYICNVYCIYNFPYTQHCMDESYLI